LFTPEEKTKDAETAIIVGVITPQQSRFEVRDHLNELEHLANTAGAEVTDRLTQSLNSPDPATFIGSGKVSELGRLTKKRDTDLVIFDDELSPVQVKNIEKQIDCKLLDRSGLILDIFASRAQTRAAKTQVELAQLDYLRSRLTRRWTHLSRQEGGIGTKGPGEKQIEMDRRMIDKRMAKLRDKLDKIDQQRQTQRKGRNEHTTVSLVGYTNAGKSTLLNALADENVFAEDRLFATLDATTRTVELDANKEVLMSDTVGFIRKLPHRLIESFKSTLDEVRESDLGGMAHGGELETSMMLHLHPELVDEERMQATEWETEYEQAPADLLGSGPLDVTLDVAEWSDSGAMGDVSAVSAAKGEAMFEGFVDELEALLRTVAE